jgi:cell division protein FtsQ
MPRRLRLALRGGAVLLVLALSAGAGAWAWTSGWTAEAAAALRQRTLEATVAAGFVVDDVLVSGRSATDAVAIIEALKINRGDPILAFDPGAAQARIEALSWVRHAWVERRLPATILVRIEERRPMAIWQHGHQLRVIDTEGEVLTETGLARFPHLPMIVGGDAPDHASHFLPLLDEHPLIGRRVVSAILVARRRWELRFDNGVTVRLPEADVAGALRRLAWLEAAHGLFDRDIVTIDLRMADRLIIQTSPLATERRLLPEEST